MKFPGMTIFHRLIVRRALSDCLRSATVSFRNAKASGADRMPLRKPNPDGKLGCHLFLKLSQPITFSIATSWTQINKTKKHGQ
jgi:hypothetical protein